MRQGLKLLVLAGSAEARKIAAWAESAGAEVRALVSEPPRGSAAMPVPCQVQDFSDLAAVTEAMRGAQAVVDASHSFDAAMSNRGFEAAQRLGLPFIAFRRPAWEDPVGIREPSIRTAMRGMIPTARVFCTTGWDSLPEWRDFPGSHLFLRQTARHDRPPPYPFVRLVWGEPPYTVESETALFRQLRIDTLVCRNIGGSASRPKIDAAEALHIGVRLIERPPLPAMVLETAMVDTVDEVLHWVAQQ